MKKLILYVLLGVALDRGVYGLGMYLGDREIFHHCKANYACYSPNYWSLLEYLTWYPGARYD